MSEGGTDTGSLGFGQEGGKEGPEARAAKEEPIAAKPEGVVADLVSRTKENGGDSTKGVCSSFCSPEKSNGSLSFVDDKPLYLFARLSLMAFGWRLAAKGFARRESNSPSFSFSFCFCFCFSFSFSFLSFYLALYGINSRAPGSLGFNSLYHGTFSVK